MPARKITDEQIDQLVALREKGKSLKEISVKLDIPFSTVSTYCLKLGADAPQTRSVVLEHTGKMVAIRNGRQVRRFTKEEDALITRLSLEGKGNLEIANLTGRNHSSIHNRLMALARHEERKEQAALLIAAE